MRLVDPMGRRVTQFVTPLAFGDLRETEPRDWLEDSTIPVEGWKGLCRILLIRLFDQAVESTRLREQMRDIGERLERVGEERDQANAVAEDLYQYFREHMRGVSENENLPAMLAEQAEHRDDLDKGNTTREEEQ